MAVIAETLGVLKTHAWVYEDARPAAPVALVWSQPTLELYGQGDAKARYADCVYGFYAALMENHIPAVMVSDEALASGKLAGFRAVVLPNLACMSDAQAHSITEFLRSGGALIASHETSLYDAAGNKRTQLALAELLGARYDAASPTTSTKNGYLCRREAHPITAWMRDTSVLPFAGRITPVRAAGGAAAPLEYGYTAALVDPEEIENPVRTGVPLLIAHTVGAGRVAYLASDVDRFYFRSRLDDARRLLGSAVAWALGRTSAPHQRTRRGGRGARRETRVHVPTPDQYYRRAPAGRSGDGPRPGVPPSNRLDGEDRADPARRGGPGVQGRRRRHTLHRPGAERVRGGVNGKRPGVAA